MNLCAKKVSPPRANSIRKEIVKNKFIYLLLFPSVLLVLFFCYLPFSGVRIAFQDYNIYRPELSTWVGFKHFKEIFVSEEMLGAVVNTLYISVLNIIIVFPSSVIFALLINEFKDGVFKKTVQSISYLPYFLSWISVIGIVTSLYSKSGPINDLICLLDNNAPRRLFMAEESFFVPNVILLSLWKEIGWGSIVYLAAIAGVDATLYEAATIDGAGKFKQAIHVTLPTIIPTVIIMLIWKIGAIFGSNFELIYGLQNPFVNFEVIQTIIYKQGIENGNYPATTAFGLAQGIVNLVMLYIANLFAKKTADISVF